MRITWKFNKCKHCPVVIVTKRPRKICKKCREALKKIEKILVEEILCPKQS